MWAQNVMEGETEMYDPRCMKEAWAQFFADSEPEVFVTLVLGLDLKPLAAHKPMSDFFYWVEKKGVPTRIGATTTGGATASDRNPRAPFLQSAFPSRCEGRSTNDGFPSQRWEQTLAKASKGRDVSLDGDL